MSNLSENELVIKIRKIENKIAILEQELQKLKILWRHKRRIRKNKEKELLGGKNEKENY
jgi:hypothetical protein